MPRECAQWRAMASTTNNPFQPGFGSRPPLLAGRERLLSKLGVLMDRVTHPPEETLARPRALGFIWEVQEGEWEPGIPSLCTYLIGNIGKHVFNRDRY